VMNRGTSPATISTTSSRRATLPQDFLLQDSQQVAIAAISAAGAPVAGAATAAEATGRVVLAAPAPSPRAKA
jgi:hypothetical protein